MKSAFLLHVEVGINYLQLLNELQMEAWALYNAVWVVNSHFSAGTVKSAKQLDRGFKDLTNGKPCKAWRWLNLLSSDVHVRFKFWRSRADDH